MIKSIFSFLKGVAYGAAAISFMAAFAALYMWCSHG